MSLTPTLSMHETSPPRMRLDPITGEPNVTIHAEIPRDLSEWAEGRRKQRQSVNDVVVLALESFREVGGVLPEHEVIASGPYRMIHPRIPRSLRNWLREESVRSGFPYPDLVTLALTLYRRQVDPAHPGQ